MSKDKIFKPHQHMEVILILTKNNAYENDGK